MGQVISIQYRGWKGHFCNGRKCHFHLNTLVSNGTNAVVISTVGQYSPDGDKYEELDSAKRFYETKAFVADNSPFQDADVSMEIDLPIANGVYYIGNKRGHEHSDIAATRVHEACVTYLASTLKV